MVIKSLTNAKQSRALNTERRFLSSLDELLKTQSFQQTSIQDIADHAGLQKAAFLKRFKSKKAALIALFEIYCDVVYANIETLANSLPQCQTVERFLVSTCQTLDRILTEHFSANRAMYEHFVDTLVVSPQTRDIFKATAVLLHQAQKHFQVGNFEQLEASFLATQLLISLTFDYKFGAMPTLPKDDQVRYEFISRLMMVALEFPHQCRSA